MEQTASNSIPPWWYPSWSYSSTEKYRGIDARHNGTADQHSKWRERRNGGECAIRAAKPECAIRGLDRRNRRRVGLAREARLPEGQLPPGVHWSLHPQSHRKNHQDHLRNLLSTPPPAEPARPPAEPPSRQSACSTCTTTSIPGTHPDDPAWQTSVLQRHHWTKLQKMNWHVFALQTCPCSSRPCPPQQQCHPPFDPPTCPAR
mmetsp:Transcript_32119/g.58046  ORF Transcript_32119/g.58046 Transcript_32119/m.58046 type:complete len:203 (+) Transcript_32119:4640-5248(+)